MRFQTQYAVQPIKKNTLSARIALSVMAVSGSLLLAASAQAQMDGKVSDDMLVVPKLPRATLSNVKPAIIFEVSPSKRNFYEGQGQVSDSTRVVNVKRSNEALNVALSVGNEYTDEQIAQTQGYTDTQVDTGVASANAYTDTGVIEAKGYTDTQVDTGVASANAYTDTGVASANAYTDTRFDSLETYTKDNFSNLNSRVDKLDERVNSIGAMAMANMAAAANVGRSSCEDWRKCIGSFSAGVGHLKGETAGAVMYSHPLTNRGRFSLGATFVDGEVGSSFGVGFDF